MNLYYELLQYPVFSMKEVSSFYESEKSARKALSKLVKDNMVAKIRNGLYTCVSGESGGPVADRFQIGSAITPTSYISHHTAFEYFGIYDQIYYDVYVSSETRFHDFEFDGYTYHCIKSISNSGVTNPQFSGGIRVTDKERTIIDAVKDINKISGLEEVVECIASVRILNEEKLVEYMKKIGSPFLYQKMGFLAELLKDEWKLSDKFIDLCKKKKGKAKRYITTPITNGVYSSDWSLIYPKNINRTKNGVMEDAPV